MWLTSLKAAFTSVRAFLNPWVLVAVLLGIGGAYALGREHGKESEEARKAREAELIQKGYDKAILAASDAIGKIQVKNTTIRQRAEVQVREVPIYKDCRNPDDMFGLLNDSLTNAEPDKSSGEGGVPNANPAN